MYVLRENLVIHLPVQVEVDGVPHVLEAEQLSVQESEPERVSDLELKWVSELQPESEQMKVNHVYYESLNIRDEAGGIASTHQHGPMEYNGQLCGLLWLVQECWWHKPWYEYRWGRIWRWQRVLMSQIPTRILMLI